MITMAQPTPLEDARDISRCIRRDLRADVLTPQKLEHWLALLNVQLSCIEAEIDGRPPHQLAGLPAGTAVRFHGHLTSIDGGRA